MSRAKVVTYSLIAAALVAFAEAMVCTIVGYRPPRWVQRGWQVRAVAVAA